MPGCGLLIGSTSRYSHGGHDVVPRAPTAAAAAAWHVAETDTTDGASMEPRGCTRWQPVANRLERVGAENSVRLSPELDPGPARIPRHPASQSCQRLPSLFHARARGYQTASSLARWMGSPPRRVSVGFEERPATQ